MSTEPLGTADRDVAGRTAMAEEEAGGSSQVRSGQCKERHHERARGRDGFTQLRPSVQPSSLKRLSSISSVLVCL